MTVEQVRDTGSGNRTGDSFADVNRIDPIVLQPEGQLCAHAGGEELGTGILENHRGGAADIVQFDTGQVSTLDHDVAAQRSPEELGDESIHRPQ